MNTPSFLKSMLETGEKQLDFIDQAEMEKERARRVPIREGILNAFPEDFREYVQIDFKAIKKERGKISINLVFEGIAPVMVNVSHSSQGRYEIGWPGYATYGVPAVGKKSGDWQHGIGMTRWLDSLEPALALGRRRWMEAAEKYGQEPVYTAPEEPA